ncbi:hypothetical protein [Leptospira levettii]|uniref:hypothetical protein n=1 Tax=Leptospira levettii TaxID=2023178 RepID=UPI00223D739F|nr:hypothetical protein [Leptospira levettii]
MIHTDMVLKKKIFGITPLVSIFDIVFDWERWLLMFLVKDSQIVNQTLRFVNQSFATYFLEDG